MAIVTKNASLSVTNPLLAILAGRQYKANFTPVPNDRMPQAITEVLEVILKELGGDFQPDAATIGISAKDGVFNRIYAPKLYSRNGNELFIKWGNLELPLVVEGGEIKPVSDTSATVKFKFTKFNPSGRGDDPGLEIKVMPKAAKGQDQLVYSTVIAVAATDWKNYDPALFDAALYGDDIYDIIAPEAERTNGGGSIKGDVIDRKQIKAAFPNGQTEQITIKVTSVKEITTSHGKSHILQCEPITHIEINAALPATADSFGMWASKSDNNILFSTPKPEVSASKPATLVIPPTRSAYLILSEQGAVAGGINLDFI